MNQKWIVGLALWMWTIAAFGQTQEILSSEFDSRAGYINMRNIGAARAVPDTLSFSNTEPFYDDFSANQTRPDSAKWFIKDITFYPLMNRHKAVLPPTRGVMTFDGIDAFNAVYQTDFGTNLGTGYADELFSHYIDLSQSEPSDSIRLSFFIQPQGIGDAPEFADSFLVYLRDTASSFVQVAGFSGGSLRDFEQISIPITDERFFHAGFQLRFLNRGSLLGPFDQWHLDYVYLGTNRTVNDTAYDDISLLYTTAPLLDPYTAIPFQQYENANLVQPVEFTVRDLRNFPSNEFFEVELSDPVGNSVFNAGFYQSTTELLPPFSLNNYIFDQLTDQAFSPDSGAYRMTIRIPSLSDAISENHTLEETYRIDSIYAYDDGEADGSYGLNAAQAFGQQFTVLEEDSLMAVWISFVPTVNCNGVTFNCDYMDERAFRLNIWDDPHPDSIYFQQVAGAVIRYGDSVNYFHRYELDFPVSLPPGNYWAGIGQVDQLSVGVGFDQTYNNQNLVFWDSAGYWVPSQFEGTLMIRPEMQNIQYNPLPQTASIEDELGLPLSIGLFPNPLTERQLNVQLETDAYIRSYQMVLRDLQGRIVYRSEARSHTEQMQFDLPKELSGGLYLVQHQLELLDGRTIQESQRLIVE